MQESEGEDRRLSPRQQLAVFLLFLGVAVVYTWPLTPNLATHIPDQHPVVNLTSDATLQSWYPWWVQKALLDPAESVFSTDWVFYPVGMEMTMQPLMLLHGAMTIPLWWMKITTANNIVILLSFALSGLAASLLGMYLFRSLPLALFCGFVFAFCPYKFQHLEGHYHLMATETLPLVALSLIRLLDLPTRRHLIWAGVWLGVTIYTDYYYFAYALLLVAVIVGYRLYTESDRLPVVQRAIAMGLLAGIIAAPLLIPALQSAARSDYGVASGHEEHKADLLSFFIPGERQLIGGPIHAVLDDTIDREAVDGIEHSVYLGWALLILCGTYAGRIWKLGGHARLFLLITAGFSILALGPELSFNGSGEWSLPLPWALLMKLPALEGARAPSRIVIIAFVGLAVWAGYALQMLLASPRVGGVRSHHLAMAIVAVTAIEYITPVRLSALQQQPWTQIVKDDPAPGIIIEMPLRPFRSAFHQPLHERKVTHVVLGRTDPEAALYYWRHDALRFFTFPQYIAVEPQQGAAALAVNLLGVRYVSLDRPILEARLDYLGSLLESAYGMEEIYRDSQTILYRYPGDFHAFRSMDLQVRDTAADLQLVYGWSNRRFLGQEGVAWMTLEHPILALPPMVDDDYELSLDLMAMGHGSMEMEVELGEVDLGRHRLTPGRNTLSILIDRGVMHDSKANLLRLHTDRSVGLPHRAGMGADPSPFSVSIEVISEGNFTRRAGEASIRFGGDKHATHQAGILAMSVDTLGHTQTRLFEHVTEGVTVDSLEAFILAAPREATIAIAACRSSLLYGGGLYQALRWIGMPEGARLNRLSSLAIIGGKDGRLPYVDTGAAKADLVLGPIDASVEAAVGLVGAKLVAR